MEHSKKRAVTLCICWLILFAILDIVIGIYKDFTGVHEEDHYIKFLLVVVCVFFYPALFLIHHYTNLAKMKKVTILSKILIIYFSLWIIVSIVKLLFIY